MLLLAEGKIVPLTSVPEVSTALGSMIGDVEVVPVSGRLVPVASVDTESTLPVFVERDPVTVVAGGLISGVPVTEELEPTVTSVERVSVASAEGITSVVVSAESVSVAVVSMPSVPIDHVLETVLSVEGEVLTGG